MLISQNGLIIIENNVLHLYSAFLGTQSALYRRGESTQPPAMLQHLPGWCNGSHIAPERPPHTSLLVERRQSDEANRCMGIIRMAWWSEANGYIFNDHRKSGPRFNISSEGQCFWQFMVLFHFMVWLGLARLVMARLGPGRFAFPPQFSTAIEWAGLFTCRYSCTASTAMTSL